MKKILLTFITLFIFSAGLYAQRIALNTDVAMDAIAAPSFGIEMTVGNKSTLSLNGFIGNKILGKDIKVAAIQPEYRVYFSGRPMHHYFVGIGGLATTYDMIIKEKHYEGDAAGLGLTFGYVIPLTKRLNVDLHAGFGAVFYRQKEYYVGDNDSHITQDGNVKANAHGYYAMPTRLGISLSYIIY